MMAPTIAEPLQSRNASSNEGPVNNGRMDDNGDRLFCKACKNYGHQQISSRLCLKNKKSKYYEGKTVEFYGIVTGPKCKPADLYSPVVHLLQKGENPVDRVGSELGNERC
jgi:hypothetical protein